MLKIRSKIDVITNSSTEVFLLNREGDLLREVRKDLKTFMIGARPAEVMEMGKGILDSSLLHWHFIFDPRDTNSMRAYRKLEITSFDDRLDLGDYNLMKEKVIASERNKSKKMLFDMWASFVSDPGRWKIATGRDAKDDPEYNDLKQRNEICHDLLHFWQGFHRGDDIDKLFDQFYKENKKLFQQKLPLPDDINARKFVGKIGVIGKSDNSIPDKCMEELMRRYPDTVRYHLG